MSDSNRAQLHQAYQLIKNGQNDEALQILRPIVIVDPNNADVWWLIANATTDPADQRSALDRVLLLRPDHQQARERRDALLAEADFSFGEAEKPKRDFAASPPVIAQPARQGTNPIVIILAVIGVFALVVCGACLVITTQGATMFGQVMATLAESVTMMPGVFNSFDDDLSDLRNLNAQGSISRGNSVSGRLNNIASYDTYTFTGETGQNITISVRSNDSDFLPEVALYDPSGALLDSSSMFSFDASLTASFSERLPSSGQYTIVVGGFMSEGRYTLSVD